MPAIFLTLEAFTARWGPPPRDVVTRLPGGQFGEGVFIQQPDNWPAYEHEGGMRGWLERQR